METAVEITVQDGSKLQVEKRRSEDHHELRLSLTGSGPCWLHWGLAEHPSSPWEIPSPDVWPSQSQPYGEGAVQTPFARQQDRWTVELRVPLGFDGPYFMFALYYSEEGRWDNNQGHNYAIWLPEGVPEETPETASEGESEAPSEGGPAEGDLPSRLEEVAAGGELLAREIFPLEDNAQVGVVAVRRGEEVEVDWITSLASSVWLHWGMARQRRNEWSLPPKSWWPLESQPFQEKAVQTPFQPYGAVKRVKVRLAATETPVGIPFALKAGDSNRWWKDGKRDFFLRLTEPPDTGAALSDPAITQEIVEAETGDHSWTLMHRYHLCHDLLEQVGDHPDRLPLLFVWLRFSAIRQLDWQRKYNTKPRELSHAQDRLTSRLAGLFLNQPETREWVRLMLTAVGRGGEGQRIRDEILTILHRHHLKEASGHFIEEWHQKLHNNTTPDDIVICQAYLEFLKRDGDLDAFYQTLEANGVTQERLAQFERPIVTPPEFIPHLKDGLIHDFEGYLRLLKSIHSGTDLEGAVQNAAHLIEGTTQERLNRILAALAQPADSPLDLVREITEVRKSLAGFLSTEGDPSRARDALHLDLALEEALRMGIERHIHVKMPEGSLVPLLGEVLENLRLSGKDDELRICQADWAYWGGEENGDPKDQALKRVALLDRLRRVMNRIMDRLYQQIQPRAEALGKALGVEPWTIPTFAEGVIRGRPVFALSMVVHHLEPLLRREAELGGWQVISRGQAAGKVEVIASLRSVQGTSYAEPTILIADQVAGDEEPPTGVTAVITPQPVDLVSHIAVRARNVPLLFATCYDPALLERLQSFQGRRLSLRVQTSGDVVFEEAEEPVQPDRIEQAKRPPAMVAPEFGTSPIPREKFREGVVGGKALQLKTLSTRLPKWIELPPSLSLPFGTFEATLESPVNKGVREAYIRLRETVDASPEAVLPQIRETLMGLEAPEQLSGQVVRVMREAGLSAPSDQAWGACWDAIKAVWASKWNERAFFSRRARGIDHDAIHMAVLIQEVVPAEYAFVLHTVHPFRDAEHELYGEVVPGLGEVLVGNYPGRALSFTAAKDHGQPTLLSYPSKSVALQGRGWIFRSDSNAEDLAGYAGAGLYDSVMVPSPRAVEVEYRKEPMMTDAEFRTGLLQTLARVGKLVEDLFQTAQDIEGTYQDGRYCVVQSRPQMTHSNRHGPTVP